MRKKHSDFDTMSAECMTDTELSEKPGGYQRTESIDILPGIILVTIGYIMTFVYHNIIMAYILVFASVALFLLAA